MKILNLKTLLPHIIAIVAFLGITLAYFPPILEGKKISQHDMMQYYGMSKEIVDFREKTGEEALWTNRMFGGMPAYLITVKYSSNLINHINAFIQFKLEKPANYLFLSLIGFYILLLLFGVNPWLAFAGSIAYAFSSYFFIIEAAGHNTKALALAYMPPIIGGFVYGLRKNIYVGTILMTVFLALQLLANHLQITYYTFLIILVFGIFYLYKSIIEKKLLSLVKKNLIILIGLLIAFSTNITSILLVYEYGKESMRGKSELTDNKENKTSGLDKDYATAWSYGITETWTLLVPNFMGGPSQGELGKNSETYKALKSQSVPNAAEICKQLPLYWGTQPFTAGPVYIGAIIFFMFIFGLIFLRGYLKWWLLAATILSISLAWGKNLMFLTEFFLDYFPGYNKFRSVSMILIIAEFTMPLLAILTIKKIFEAEIDKAKFLKALKISLGIVGGLLMLFAIMPSMFFNFSSDVDNQLISAGWPDFLVNALKDDRKSMLVSDSFRSLIFILLFVGALMATIYKKINIKLFYALFAILLVADMWTVNKRYLNNDNFVSKKEEATPFKPTQADLQILNDKDPNFRVYNLSVSPFNDAGTSYFHNSIGGYHGAKMKRYQELIENHISKNNISVLNMLNTKYYIVPNKEVGPMAQRNMGALGNAWFVESYRLVENADSEIVALNNFDPKVEMIIDKRFSKFVENKTFARDSIATIQLVDYKPNHLTYKSKANSEQLAIFSEIYYNSGKGWNAYIDGQSVEHFRANYVLRAMPIPAGEHTIEYKFEPKNYYLGEKISLIASIVLILSIIAVIVIEIKKKKKIEVS